MMEEKNNLYWAELNWAEPTCYVFHQLSWAWPAPDFIEEKMCVHHHRHQYWAGLTRLQVIPGSTLHCPSIEDCLCLHL